MAKSKTLETNDEQIIEGLEELTGELLRANWGAINRIREGQDGMIGVAMAYRIDYNGEERTLKATISFGKRIHESREKTIDPRQPLLVSVGVDNQSE